MRFVNPAHPGTDELAEDLRSTREAELAILARQDEVTKLGRLSEEERISSTSGYEAIAQTLGVDVEDLRTRHHDVVTNKSARLIELLNSPFAQTFTHLSPLNHEPGPPGPTDHSFWWAETEWAHPGDFTSDFRDDGLHFGAGISHHSGDLRIDRFGAWATFEVQPERIPHSSIGRWRSTPHVELFGGVRGYSGTEDIFTGDLWSKCWMYRRQRLFQRGIGPTGPEPIVRGEREEWQTLIFEEDGGRAVRFDMPGFQWMPPIDFGGVSTADSLFCELKISFEIQVEGAGTILWADPEVLLRTFQWPLTPL